MWCTSLIYCKVIHPICLCYVPLESKAESNQTQCYLGYKNNLLVYKVESAMKVDTPNTVKIIAVERQSTAEIEVQVWKTVEGTATMAGNYIHRIIGQFWEITFSFEEFFEKIDTIPAAFILV